MCTHPRKTTVLGLSVGAALLLTACGGPGADPSGSATVSPTTSQPASTPSDTSSAPASSTPTPSASTADPSGSPSDGTGTEDGGEAFTTQSGAFTWTVPSGWTAEQTEYDEEPVQYQGVPYEVVEFQGPDEGITYQATMGVGATDNDGPKPDIVAVLDAEELTEVPVVEGDSGFGTGPVWYRTTLLQENGSAGEGGFFEGEEFALVVEVVNVPAGADPEAVDDSHWQAWTYVRPPAEGQTEGTGGFLSGRIDQSTAEALTGKTGEDALRAVLDTPEYAQLRELSTSMEVDVDAVP